MLIISFSDNEIIEQNGKVKNEDKEKQSGGASYSKSVRAK